MFLGDIWWNQLPDSIHFYDSLKAELSAGMNVIYICKNPLPWLSSLYNKVQESLGEISSTKTLEHIRNENGCAPGKIILKKFCTDEIQANYWPGQSYAEYLASLDVTALNNKIIWVENINDAATAGSWIDFIKTYNKKRPEGVENNQRAIFVLGCSGDYRLDVNKDYITTCTVPFDAFDKYMFCAMNTSDIKCSYYLKQYIAELAFNMGGDNLELCGELAIKGEELITTPNEIYKQVFQYFGKHPSEYKKDEILKSCIRVAQMKILFPVLEEKRLELIKKYREDLLCLLPVQDSLGEFVSIPENLEIGTLHHLYCRHNFRMDPKDQNSLFKYREIRNCIAHNDLVPANDMIFLLR